MSGRSGNSPRLGASVVASAGSRRCERDLVSLEVCPKLPAKAVGALSRRRHAVMGVWAFRLDKSLRYER